MEGLSITIIREHCVVIDHNLLYLEIIVQDTIPSDCFCPPSYYLRVLTMLELLLQKILLPPIMVTN